MTPDNLKPARWHQIKNLYTQALEMEESQRAAFLREACVGDDDLRHDLEKLLAEDSGSFLEVPALQAMAREFAATPAASWIGRRIGNYEFLSLAGAGGMGEVYRAHDTKLKREVAIKILPGEFAHDPDRVSRFQREAQLLATLNHPNIGAIYGLEEDGGLRFLILELVEGETLAERLKRGPIPLDDALKIATQIAEGLGAAHDCGILHRDLKPANIKLTPDGKVKLLDFGLAKAFAAGRGSNSNLPTEATVTMPGIIMGTASYMSPEHASGKDTDRTSDVWAFGCVLYEMFTGHRVFEGETVTEILSNVMKTEPDWTRLPEDTPDGIRRLLRRCLQKERRSRLHDIADARIEIEETQSGPRVKEHAAVISKWSFARVAGITALVVGLAGAFVAGGLYFRGTTDKTAKKPFEISLPQTAGAFAVSPDGSKFVFVDTMEGQSRLWLRSLDSPEDAKPMAGTEGVIGSPFWSPNSQSIGFFPGNALKRIDVIGGSVRNLEWEPSSDLKGSREVRIFSAPTGAWGPNDTIVFAPNADTPLYRVPEKGGWGVPLTRLDRPRQLVHHSPQFLPDGHHFLFYADGPAEGRGVYIASLESPEPRRLFDADGPAVFMPPDYLLFIRHGALYAQRFDNRKLAPVDESILIAPQAASVSAAAGVIAYRPQATSEPKFTWFDRTAKSEGTVGESLFALEYNSGARLSPDGKWLAMHRSVLANIDVWLFDVIHGFTEKLTDGPLVEGFPIWSADSKFVAFNRSISGTQWDLYVKPADRHSAETVLLSEPSQKRALDWSPDGRFILYVLRSEPRSSNPSTGHLYALPVTPEGKPDGKPIPLTDTNKSSWEDQAQFSPDGRWIAYQSNESGKDQIYLQPFLRPGKRQPVTTEGGTDVRWPRKGKELFYLAPGNKLMAVPIVLYADGQTPGVGTPTPIAPNLRMQPHYSVRDDGQRILMNATTGEPNNPPVVVISNWKPPSK